MRFKEKALKALAAAEEQDCGVARTVIRECRELVEKIPDEECEKTRCVKPDYERMCKELEAQLTQTKQELEACTEVNRYLRTENERLTGFREAVLRIFPKEEYCHGIR